MPSRIVSVIVLILILIFNLISLASAFSGDVAVVNEQEISLAERALAEAGKMIGRPYKYRGETPAGFDCSGLVRHSYRAVGMDVPRATSELKEATRHIPYEDLRKGDLVFFDRNGKRYGHVGIYAGEDRFVHAPSRGKLVRIDSLQDEYWKKRFSGARRFSY